MRRLSIPTIGLAIGLLLAGAPVFGQAAATDSQTLQDLLHEVRQLRKDLQASITTAQKAQIVLYRMQSQQAVVARMQQRVDNARLIMTDAQTNRKNLENQIKADEDLKEHSQNAAERKEIEDVIPPLKAKLDEWVAEEPQDQNRVIEAEGHLQTEQAKLDALQAELDQLERVIDSLARQPENVK